MSKHATSKNATDSNAYSRNLSSNYRQEMESDEITAVVDLPFNMSAMLAGTTGKLGKLLFSLLASLMGINAFDRSPALCRTNSLRKSLNRQ